MRIHKRIALLVVACILPVWLFVGYLTLTSFQRGRQDLEQSLAAAAQTQLRVVEREIAVAEASLHALATSPALDKGDYAAFHAQAQSVLRLTPNLNIVLLNSEGAQVVNTLQPYGQPLPNKPGPFFREVRDSGKTVLSDLFVGPLTNHLLAALAIPVFRDGRMIHVMTVSLDTDHLTPILKEEGYPASWAAAVFDRKGIIVARTWEPEKYVGKKAGAAFFKAFSGAPRGLVDAPTLEGINVLAAYSRSELYGWTVAVAVPKEILEAELRRTLWINLSAGAALLMLGLGLARWISRGITDPVRSLIPSAEAIGRGEPVPAEPLQLTEAEDVRHALADAAALIEARTAERDLARIREFEIKQQHHSLRALNDIAALPGADHEWQLVESLRLGARHFGLPVGIISQIEDGVYTILHHCAPDATALSDGETFDLGTTYAALTLAADRVMDIPHVSRSEHAAHPCHVRFGLEAYIGAPLHVRGEVFGTVSFSSIKPLGRDFEEADREFVLLLARWIGTVIERQLSDAEIAATRHDLERSNAELERFAYVASHDLRQPLRMVSSYLGLIQRRMGDSLKGEMLEFFGYAMGGAKRMDQMILDLLDYSRTGSGTAPFKSVPLSDVLTESLANLQLQIAEAGTTIDTPESLPTVQGHRSELVRLFQNLIGNAVKYRSPGRPGVVHIQYQTQNQEWVFTIRDNGIGIAPADRERAFLIFERLVSLQTHEGTGIGLAVCRKIVESHGGRIWIEDGLEGGTALCFTLPHDARPRD